MRVLFASGDVGGARALLPVIECCIAHGISILLLDHSHISKEAPVCWERISPEGLLSQDQTAKRLKEKGVRALVFTTSVKDTLPLTLARWAKGLGILVFHLLDNWTGYRERMGMDGLPLFSPDQYIVMDEIAYGEAAESGIDPSRLAIAGHPALSTLPGDYRRWKSGPKREMLRKYGFNPKMKLIAFVSEPVKQDQGDNPESSAFRGYTEKIVLRIFCEALQPFSKEVEIAILPHPREEKGGLLTCWNENRGLLKGGLLQFHRGRDGVFFSDAIAGMASLLLYEAWLLGKPVLSLQPGVRQRAFRMLEEREGLMFVDSYSEVSASVAQWVRDLLEGKKQEIRPELAVHEKAPEMVYELIRKHLGEAEGRS